MKRWKQLIATFAVVAGVGAASMPVQNAAAINVFDQCGSNGSAAVCKSKNDQVAPMIQTIINMILYILGAVAVVMIVIGGIRYTTSNGDAGSIKSAKETILYSVVGLIVAILSYSIVNFVLSWF